LQEKAKSRVGFSLFCWEIELLFFLFTFSKTLDKGGSSDSCEWGFSTVKWVLARFFYYQRF
jgi:hypothetical protein